jgi:hypothetical protein
VTDLTAQLARQKDFVQKMQEEERALEAEKQMAYHALEQCRVDLYQSRHRMEAMEGRSAGTERGGEGRAGVLDAAEEACAHQQQAAVEEELAAAQAEVARLSSLEAALAEQGNAQQQRAIALESEYHKSVADVQATLQQVDFINTLRNVSTYYGCLLPLA